jgi:hypothetical protein
VYVLLKKKLADYDYKTITIEQLTKLAGPCSYPELADMVNGLVGEKQLEPVKASKTNGRRPSLYNKYRILRQEADYSTTLEEIKLLHPAFNHSKYVKQPAMYLKYQNEIDSLSKFLWEHENLLDSPMSVNERSFQIWGVEKLLKEKSVIQTIFQFNDWDLSLLNYYETPEPFFEYHFSKAKEMNILIIENKDTWFGLRKIMREAGLNHLFRHYHVLLYGEGKKIISRSNRFKEYDGLFAGSTNTYYYFGDLDYEGIDIYQILVSHNPELRIHLSTELYSWMLKESAKFLLPETKAGQKKINIDEFLENFSSQEVDEIKQILEKGRYIPQEILNYSLLKDKMMEGSDK